LKAIRQSNETKEGNCYFVSGKTCHYGGLFRAPAMRELEEDLGSSTSHEIHGTNMLSRKALELSDVPQATRLARFFG